MADVDNGAPIAPSVPDMRRITVSDLLGALKCGWRDFTRAPLIGLFFSVFYVWGGLVLFDVFGDAGYVAYVIILALGFPLIAPFCAVGYYEISHRLDMGQTFTWRDILGVVAAEKDRQIPWLGAIIVIAFLFWSFLAHMIFALFMGLSAMTNISTSHEAFLTPEGLTMIAVELVVAAVFFFILFALTVFALPLLLDRDIDFVTAMIVSVSTTFANFWVMILWGEIVVALLFIGMMPMFLGLIVILPVLGHATWHLYRRVSSSEGERRCG
ncbi:MAG: DUF2189 domain-containing protein [Brevirhabdus sp.]